MITKQVHYDGVNKMKIDLNSWNKSECKSKKIKTEAKDIKEKISNSKENFAFAWCDWTLIGLCHRFHDYRPVTIYTLYSGGCLDYKLVTISCIVTAQVVTHKRASPHSGMGIAHTWGIRSQ